MEPIHHPPKMRSPKVTVASQFLIAGEEFEEIGSEEYEEYEEFTFHQSNHQVKKNGYCLTTAPHQTYFATRSYVRTSIPPGRH
jgi:hypothetical protein